MQKIFNKGELEWILKEINTGNELCIDIKNGFTYNNIRRKAYFSSGLTTLKLATKREYIAQWCYCSLFKYMEDYKQLYEISERLKMEDYDEQKYKNSLHVSYNCIAGCMRNCTGK